MTSINSRLASLAYSPTTGIYTAFQRGTTVVLRDFFKSLGEAADWCVANGWELQSPAPIETTHDYRVAHSTGPIDWQGWTARTREIEDAIWARVTAFEKRFCHDEELIDVRLSSEAVKVVFLVPDGGTWTDGFPLTELIDFISQTLLSEEANP